MTCLKKKSEVVFSIRKIKENPFNGLNEMMIHKNKNLILLKERKLEWENEYFLIYNADNRDHN